MAATKEAPAKDNEKAEGEEKEPSRDDLIKASLSRADMSLDLKSYDDAQLERAATASPRRRGKSLREFILHGDSKPSGNGQPRARRRVEWLMEREHQGESGFYAMLSRDDGKTFEPLGLLPNTSGAEFEKSIAEALGVKYEELDAWLREHDAQVLTVNNRFVSIGVGAEEEKQESED